jgi:hypothetical protein
VDQKAIRLQRKARRILGIVSTFSMLGGFLLLVALPISISSNAHFVLLFMISGGLAGLFGSGILENVRSGEIRGKFGYVIVKRAINPKRFWCVIGLFCAVAIMFSSLAGTAAFGILKQLTTAIIEK